MDGLLVIDKPAGPTSHDVVARVRRVLGERRVGHTGTLDPAASGVLPLVVGRATRLARFLSAGEKEYEAVVQLGTVTDTYDAQGAVVGGRGPLEPPVPTEAIAAALGGFLGTYLQQPPAFSAKKIAGRRSYDLARSRRARQEEADAMPAPARVTAHRLELLDVDGDRVRLRVVCSAGFYVRVLAHELGQRLGTGGHLAALRRTSCAGLSIAGAIPLDVAEASREAAARAVVPLVDMLAHVPAVVLTDQGIERALHGREIGPAEVEAADRAILAGLTTAELSSDTLTAVRVPVRLIDGRRRLVAVALASSRPGVLHPCVVLM